MVFATGQCRARIVNSTPNYHFITCPDGRVTESGGRRVSSAASRPTVHVRIISPAGVQEARVISTPDNHFAVRPYCRVTSPCEWNTIGARAQPCICVGIVSPASVEVGVHEVVAAPHNHLTVGPD